MLLLLFSFSPRFADVLPWLMLLCIRYRHFNKGSVVGGSCVMDRCCGKYSYKSSGIWHKLWQLLLLALATVSKATVTVSEVGLPPCWLLFLGFINTSKDVNPEVTTQVFWFCILKDATASSMGPFPSWTRSRCVTRVCHQSWWSASVAVCPPSIMLMCFAGRVAVCRRQGRR